MMLYYFELIAIISLFCLGLRAITDDGMIGHPIRKFFLEKLPTFGKPIVLCATCMSSFWGTVIYWSYSLALNEFDITMIPNWIAICISTSFVNSLFWAYYESINMCKTK